MPSWRAVRPSRSRASAAKRIKLGRAARPTLESLEGRVVMTITTALDPSFGQRGLVYGQPASGSAVDLSRLSAVAVQSDGKVVEVGSAQVAGSNVSAPTFLLVRLLNADGTPDTTFGTSGSFTVPAPNTTSVAIGTPGEVSVQADGSILFLANFLDGSAPSSTDYYSAVVKVTPGGTLDPTFGTGGEALVPASAQVGLGDLVVQPDGQLLVASSRTTFGTGFSSTYSLTLTRFSAAGVLDTSFGTDGTVALTPPQPSEADVSNQVNLVGAESLPGGQILLVGNTSSSPAFQPGITSSNILARVNADGTLDAGFGTGGFATFRIGSDRLNVITAAAQPDGKVLLAGQDFSTSPFSQFLARFLPDGSVDPTFNPDLAGRISRVAVADDGTITLAGVVGVGSTSSSGSSPTNNPNFVQRLRADGGADTTFGTGGRTFYRLNPATYSLAPSASYSSIVDLALSPGGGVVVASAISDASSGAAEAAIARLLPVVVAPTPGDYDGDGTSDPAVLLANGVFAYRTASGDTTLDLRRNSTNPAFLPAAGDYDGDGITDPAAYYTAQGSLHYHGSANHPNAFVNFGPIGAGQTIPAPGDYNGDGRTDVAAYLPSLGEFAIRTDAVGNPGDQFVPFGIAGAGQTIPAPGDYDGDGKTDLAAYLPALGLLAYRPSTGGPDVYVPFGQTGDQATIPAPGDYDGDGKADVAAYLPALGILAYRPSTGGPDVLTNFGATGLGASIPAPGDYDGDGRTDVAVYLPRYAIFAYRPSSGGPDVLQAFGAPGTAVSVPAASIPYAQPAPVAAMALAAAPDDATIDLPLTDDVLATLAGKAKPKA